MQPLSTFVNVIKIRMLGVSSPTTGFELKGFDCRLRLYSMTDFVIEGKSFHTALSTTGVFSGPPSGSSA